MTRTEELNRWKKNTRESIEGRVVDGDDGCRLWTGKVGSNGGYGSVNFDGKLWLVHRLFYVWNVGPIPDGMHIDHLCNVRNCVETTHLEAVTPSENSIRAGKRREVCKNGHPTSLYRKRVSTTGETYCIKCSQEAAEKRRRERGVQLRGSATECEQGHSYAEHGGVDTRGVRYCKECRRIWLRNKRAKK